MEVSDYLSQPGLKQLVKEANIIKNSGKRFSDIEDEIGYQYVDLVMEAQGISFMSLLGYTAILEEAGLRFFNVAGVSAGAFNAMVVAALGPSTYKSIYILKTLNRLSSGRRPDARPVKSTMPLLSKVSQLTSHLFSRQTNYFKQSCDKHGWIYDFFQELDIHTQQQVYDNMQRLPNGMKHVFGGSIADLSPRLAIITSDVTTHSKIELPRMAKLFWNNPETVSPVELIRAGMAMPYLQESYGVDSVPAAGTSYHHDWQDLLQYTDTVPGEINFMDGSIIYHLPMTIFNRVNQVTPRMPTFGVTVTQDARETDSLDGFTTSFIRKNKEEIMDSYLENNPECRSLLTDIRVPATGNQTAEEEKLTLFRKGAESALEFLSDFDWQTCKASRNEGLSHRFFGPYFSVRSAS